jgi:DNA-binding FadR family transcriptional regulator
MKTERLSDRIAQELEQSIIDGALSPGERLPAERQLAERLGVSRPSLREAIQKLASKGLLHSRQGGGTYVAAAPQDSVTDPLMEMLLQHPDARYDVHDRQRIRDKFDHMVRLRSGDSDPVAEARADADFHLSIAEASHNIVLLHLMRKLFSVLQRSIEHNLDKLYTIPRVSEPLRSQHQQLMLAVVEGAPEKARQAAYTHLVFVEESLQGIDEAQARHERFLRQASLLPGT